MKEQIVEWYGDEHSRIYKKQSRYLFALLAFVFYGLPQLQVDKMPFVIKLEQLIGMLHPSILYVSELPRFGSQAALLLLFVNIVYPFYIMYALINFNKLGRIKKQINYFKKIGFFLGILFIVVSVYIVFFNLIGKQYEYPSSLEIIILNNEIIFFLFIYSVLTIQFYMFIGFFITLRSLFRMK